MPPRTRFLDEISSEYNQPGWLDDNGDAVYSTISRMLRHDNTVHQGIDTLLLVFPYVLNREDVKRWGKLIKDALSIYRGIEKEHGVTQPAFYVLNQREKRVRLTRTKRRPRDKVVGFEMLEIYLMLLMGTLYFQSEVLTEQRINDIFRMARTVNDPPLYHKLYQTLAFVYVQKREYDKAMDFAQLAYMYWSKRDPIDPDVRLEQALTSYAYALIYHGRVETEPALAWLETAANLFATTEYPLQHGVVALQKSAIYIVEERFEEAIQWAEYALNELIPLEAKYYIGVGYHYLGMGQAYIDHPDAMDNLQRSIDVWRDIGNQGMEIYVNNTLAFAEARAGRTNEALERLHTCLVLLRTMPEDKTTSHRRERIRKLIRAIEDGEDLRELRPKK